MQEIIDKTKKFVFDKYSKYNGKFGPQFMKIVTKESVKLAYRLSKNNNLNKSALILGAYLHDIGRITTDSQEHTTEGKKIAETFLRNNNVKDEKILEIVFDCILNHGFKARPTTNEGKIIQFIDKAVLINPEIIKVYYYSVLKEKDKITAKQIILTKLEKWYNSLGDKKQEFKDEYKECLDYIHTIM